MFRPARTLLALAVVGGCRTAAQADAIKATLTKKKVDTLVYRSQGC